METSAELKKIKKLYGENFMHLCRSLFPTILEKEGALLNILENCFANNSNSLYETIEKHKLEADFKEYIYGKYDSKREEIKEETRTPYEILDEAGYELIECKTEEEIQNFGKYYAPNEVLCTIYNGGRLESHFCFFAVKKDVDKIRREEFSEPKKDDAYSLSVLAIQFPKDETCSVQIISRYNHTVKNPNCTLGNNLENLAPGLSQSFSNLLKERGLTLNTKNVEDFEIPGYTLANDGKYYQYNFEYNGIYYCPDNIVIERNEAKKVGEPEQKILMDNFVLDLKNKTIKQYGNERFHDSFVDAFQNIEKIEVVKDKEKGTRKVIIHTAENDIPAIIEINKNNEIVGYENENLREVEDKFLCSNTALEELNVSNLHQAGGLFLYYNEKLTKLNAPNLQQVGNWLLYKNKVLKELNAPKLPKDGEYTDYIKGLIEQCQRNGPTISSEDLAILDKGNQITTQEIKGAGRFFEKKRNIFKRNNSKDKSNESER